MPFSVESQQAIPLKLLNFLSVLDWDSTIVGVLLGTSLSFNQSGRAGVVIQAFVFALYDLRHLSLACHLGPWSRSGLRGSHVAKIVKLEPHGSFSAEEISQESKNK